MSRLSPLVLLAILCTLSPVDSHARKTPVAEISPAARSAPGPAESPGRGVIGTGVLQSWTFDVGGSPNAQGWTTVDRTAQPPLFHVANGPGSPPFSGQAMWLGVNSANCSASDACGYVSLPGYGNDWTQRLQSSSFVVNNNGVAVKFLLAYDMEPSYDFLYLEYTTGGDIWTVLGTWTGSGNTVVSKTIAAGTYTSPIRIRFRFVSDGSVSDEDGLYNSNGPVYIDNLKVINDDVTIDTHDFTAEALNAVNTVDGHWMAVEPPTFGDNAALFDGDTVVQEDPGTFNSTNVWGFFNGSLENYACGGFPGQAVVPHGSTSGGIENYIRNEIQSPVVSITALGATEPVMLTFDGYADLPTANVVSYEYRVRSKVAGIWQRWRAGTNWLSPTKAWVTRAYNLRGLIPSGATDIQIGLGVRDLCPIWCGVGSFGDGSCHSHGPLFDNISVTGSNTATGAYVEVTPPDPGGTSPVTITFYNVTQPGLTTLVMSPTGPPVSSSFQVGNGTYYNIESTATTTGNIEVCFQYDEATLTVPEASLRVGHWDTQLSPAAWVDVTYYVDTIQNRVYAITNHLSPFVIGAGSVTAVGGGPTMAALRQNVPNPFNPVTTITYAVPGAGAHVSIRVYDTAGRLVRTLVDRQEAAGSHDVTWDGRDQFGTTVSSGVYFYKMTAGSFVESRRMVLLK